MAVEASRISDFNTAIFQGKEIYKKNKTQETAKILKSITQQITEKISNNNYSIEDIRKNNRLTRQIQQLCQQALTICSEKNISDYINDFKNYELLNFVFSQCDAGDYRSLIEKIEKEDENLFSSPSSTSSSYPLTPSKCDALPTYINQSPYKTYNNPFKSSAAKKQKQYHQIESKDLNEEYGNSIFNEQYHENFLVLNTEKAMKMCTKFILLNKIDSKEKKKVKKEKGIENDPIKYGNELIDYLLSNKCVMASLNIENLMLEYIYKGGVLHNEDYSNQIDINSYFKLIKISLENVCKL